MNHKPFRWSALQVGAFIALASVLLPGRVAGQAAPSDSHGKKAKVLLVGTYQGKKGKYASIQDAVNAAAPGDWILIAPGDYREHGADNAGVLIATPNLHVRGMNRNRVILDGTMGGFDACSSDPAAQDFGPGGTGRNGIEVLKTNGVSIENLTACNFLGGTSGENGNQIWWNGGDGSGVIGLGSFSGSYLTASSTFFDASIPNAGQYGIFVSNASGPGSIERSYASNMADSSFYVGACPDCKTVLRRVHAQNSALGYSGTNAGGHLIVEDSEWDLNRVGILPSSLANDDPPSPQDGACPNDATKSCTLIQRNYVHDNNNPNTPASALAGGSPVGTGIDLSGGRNNTVQYNLVTNNGAWGIVVNDYPDPDMPAVSAWCNGGDPWFTPPAPYDAILGPIIPCFFHSFGNRVHSNVFAGNGFFGNDTNGDLANAALPYVTNNCFHGNVDLSGTLTTAPASLEDGSVAGTCSQAWNPDPLQESGLFLQLICAAYGPGSGACLGGPGYPQTTAVALLPIPKERSMPNPCAGVPKNEWCNN